MTALRVHAARFQTMIRAAASSAASAPPSLELVLLRVLHARLDLGLECNLERFQALGFILTKVAERDDLLHSALPERHPRGEVREVGHVRLHVGALRAPPPREAGEHRLPKASTRIGHGERGTAFAALGVDHVGPGVLHVLVQVRDLVGLDGLGNLVLREERKDRLPGVAPHHRDADEVGVLPRGLGHELVRADNVQGRDADDLHGVQALLLVELRHGWND
mmetsp:Transcript_98544/g.261887  ORF Transcript_98544/g.261887 Transcript_98544/m.261887 type:complete len:221 (+) Transcript_98544:152-814(+)